MDELDDVKTGWDFMAQVLGVDFGAQRATQDYQTNVTQNQAIQAKNTHIQQVNNAIDELARSINEHPYRNLGVEQFKGYVAEEWHANTFNIHAAEQGSNHRAWTLQDHGYGSVDVTTNFNRDYSLKYSNTAKQTENMQAAINPETGEIKYPEMYRLGPVEQTDSIIEIAMRRSNKNKDTRPVDAAAHKEVGEKTVGIISDDQGIESDGLSIKGSKKVAKDGHNGTFDPEKYGYKKELFLDEVQIEYLNQALKAGLTAASITAITELVPELFKVVDYLVKHGEIDPSVLAQSGERIVTVSAESFLRGAIAYALEMAIQNGLLGEVLQQVSPSIVGAAVAVVIRTIKDSILVAAGKMEPKEMGIHFVDSIIVSSGYLLSMKIGGIIVQALLPELPGIGYAIGSLLGCSISVVYNIGKKKLISFCVDTGFTCFGLVDQNYELPEQVLKELGVETIPIPRTEVERVDVMQTQVTSTGVDRTEYETIHLTVLKRGIIDVNKVGYVA